MGLGQTNLYCNTGGIHVFSGYHQMGGTEKSTRPQGQQQGLSLRVQSLDRGLQGLVSAIAENCIFWLV